MNRFKQFFLLCLLMIPALSAFCQIQLSDEQLASQYVMSREFDKAVEIYERLYDKNPALYYYTYYTNCLIELKDYEKAEKVIKKHIRNHSKEPRFLVDLGYVYSLEGENRKTEDAYEDAIRKLQPEQQQVIDLSNAFLMRRQNDYAVKAIEKGRQLMPGGYPFSLELAYIYERTEDFFKMFGELLDLAAFDYQYLPTVKNRLQDALAQDPDNIKNEAFKNILLKRIQKNPEIQLYSEMMIWYAIQQKDFASALQQAKSLDRRNGENGQRVYEVGKLAASGKDYDNAIEAFAYVVQSKPKDSPFYLSCRLALLDTRMDKLTSDYNYTNEQIMTLENDFTKTLTELGKSKFTIPLMQSLAHLQAFYLAKNEAATSLLQEAIDISIGDENLLAESKMELADILLFSGDQWEATLLYSQVEKDLKNDPLGHEAKFRNARLFYFIGEFGWAKAQLDVLKAATSKLIANDAMQLSLLISDNTNPDSTTTELAMYARADFLLFRNRKGAAIQILDSLIQMYPTHSIVDEAMYKEAEIRLLQGRFSEADTLLGKVVTLYPYDILADDALFKRAILAEEQLNNSSKAMEYYLELINKYPGSFFTTDARKKYRALRRGK